MSFVALSSFARKARSASRVGVGSALCVALNVTSIRFRSGFSFLWRTSSCIAYRSMRLKTSRALDFAVSSARTTTTPWDGMPYRTAVDQGAHRPSEILAQGIRESQRDFGEFSERGGRTFR